jgi:hypothetical protein
MLYCKVCGGDCDDYPDIRGNDVLWPDGPWIWRASLWFWEI